MASIEDHRDTELQDRLQAHLLQVVRERDPHWSPLGHQAVRDYIHQQLCHWGEVQTYTPLLSAQPPHNLILNLPGRDSQPHQPLILIGAHYDAVAASPGADDNGSGVAVLLELARSLALNPARFPVRLVAFDQEEYGLVGSRAYADKLQQQGQQLRLMLSLEMLGYTDSTPGSQRYPPGLARFYPHRGDFIALIGNLRTLPDLIRLSRRMRQTGTPCEWLPAGNRGLLVPETRRSDHAPFWDRGYGAILVTDTAHLRNPHYHRISDRVETLDLPFLTGVCRGLTEGILKL